MIFIRGFSKSQSLTIRQVRSSNGGCGIAAKPNASMGGLPAGVLVGMEASGHYPWYERLLSKCGHQLSPGDASRTRASVVRKRLTAPCQI